MKKLVSLVLCVTMALGMSVTGCPGFISVAQTAATWASDGAILLQALKAAFDFFLATSGTSVDAKTVAAIDAAFQDAALSLDTALRATQGVESLSQQDLETAFADFKAAYSNLVTLLSKVGAVSGVPGGALLVTHGGQNIIRIPLAFRQAQ